MKYFFLFLLILQCCNLCGAESLFQGRLLYDFSEEFAKIDRKEEEDKLRSEQTEGFSGIGATKIPPNMIFTDETEITVRNNQSTEGWTNESLGILLKILNVHEYPVDNIDKLAQDLVSLKKPAHGELIKLVCTYKYPLSDLTVLRNDLDFVQKLKNRGCIINSIGLDDVKITIINMIINHYLASSEMAVVLYCSEKSKNIEYHEVVSKYLAERMIYTVSNVLHCQSNHIKDFARLLSTAARNLELLDHVRIQPQPFTKEDLVFFEKVRSIVHEKGSCIVQRDKEGVPQVFKSRWNIFAQSIQKMSFRLTILKASGLLMLFSFLPINNWNRVRTGIVLYWVYMVWYGVRGLF